MTFSSLKSEVPSPKSQVQSPKSQVPSLKSQVSSLKSEVRSLKSEVRSPKSEVRSLKSACVVGVGLGGGIGGRDVHLRWLVMVSSTFQLLHFDWIVQ